MRKKINLPITLIKTLLTIQSKVFLQIPMSYLQRKWEKNISPTLRAKSIRINH